MSRDPRDITDVFAREPVDEAELRADGATPAGFPDPARTVTVELPGAGSPPLILVSDRRLSQVGFAKLRESIRTAAESRVPVVIADAGLTFFQLVDGRWQPLKGDRPSHGDRD